MCVCVCRKGLSGSVLKCALKARLSGSLVYIIVVYIKTGGRNWVCDGATARACICVCVYGGIAPLDTIYKWVSVCVCVFI